MRISTATKISFEDTRDYDFYTILVEAKDQASFDSLEEYLESEGYESEGGGDASGGFTSDKNEWENKKQFEKAARKDIRDWKASVKAAAKTVTKVVNLEDQILLARMVYLRDTIDTFEEAFLKDLLKDYKEAAKSITKAFGALDADRMLALEKDIRLTIAIISDRLGEATGYAGEYTYKEMNKIISWDGRVEDFNAIQLSSQQIKAMVMAEPLSGKLIEEWIGSALLPELDSLKSEIRQGMIKGESYSKIASRLDNLLNAETQKRHIETVVRTYIAAINSKANEDIYRANQHVIKKVEWSALMEQGNTKTGRGTCPRCMALDGQRYPVEGPKPAIPLHARCRCVYAPVTLTWEELGFDIPEMEKAYRPWTERIGKARKLDNYGFTGLDYSNWWKTQPETWQNNAIGPRRADLVRDGFVKFNDLVDKQGNLILIKDLI